MSDKKIKSTAVTTHHESGILSTVTSHWKLILAGIIVLFTIVIILKVIHSPFWDLFKDLFDGINRAAAILDDQLTECSKSVKDFFNPGSGCFIGISILSFVFVSILGVVGKFYMSKNAAVEANKAITNRSNRDQMGDLIKKQKALSDDDIKEAIKNACTVNCDQEIKPEQIKAFRQSLNEKYIQKSSTDTINNTGLSPADKAAKIAEYKQMAKDAIDRVNEENNLDDDEVSENDKATNEIVEE